MKNWILLLALVVGWHLGWGQASRRGASTWYGVQNHILGQKGSGAFKPLKATVLLPNGNRLEPLTDYVILPTGEQSPLQPDDVVLPSGEIVRVGPASAPVAPAATSVPAAASVPVATPAPATPTPVAAGGATPAASPVPATARPATAFGFVPPAPVGGTLRGVVELGASGFNSFIVRIDAQRRWKLEKAEFGNSLVLENMATDDDIRRGLKAYIGKMLDYGVDGRNIQFVVSSGAASASGTRPIMNTLKALGYVVNVVTPEQEGAYGVRAAVPAAYADRAFLVDMGSANTKIGWLSGGATTVVSTYGSKFYQQSTPEATVVADVQAKASQVPAGHRATCFIIGGVPFELAKALRQGQEPYTVLKPAADYTQLDGAKAKAGQVIYAALTQATGCQQFVFSWDANFTIGYLLSK